MDWDNLQDKLLSLGEGLGFRLKDLFGSRNERLVRGLTPLVQRANELESWAKGLSAEQFHAQTALWKAHIAEGKIDLDAVLPDAFALCREAARRTLGLRHYAGFKLVPCTRIDRPQRPILTSSGGRILCLVSVRMPVRSRESANPAAEMHAT
jgi:hypothetical protein